MTLAITGERVVVTGSTGYLGSFLVPKLRNDNEVHVLARNANAARLQLDLPMDQVHAGLESPLAIARLFEDISPTLVFHLATHYERRDDTAKLRAMVDANVGFGALVLAAASNLQSCDVVVAGSHFQFAGPERNSASFYAATKNALCGIAAYLQEAAGLSWIQTVLFDVYGPADTRPKLVSTLIDRVRAGEPVSLPNPEPLHHFVYVDDVVDALVASAVELRTDDRAAGRNVFATSQQLLAPSAVLQEVAAVVGREPVIADDPFELPPNSIMAPVSGPRPHGWVPRVSIRKGIEQIVGHPTE